MAPPSIFGVEFSSFAASRMPTSSAARNNHHEISVGSHQRANDVEESVVPGGKLLS